METLRAELEAKVVTARKVVVAWVMVALVAMSPPLKVCCPVQVLGLARFRAASTAPVLVEIVRVASEAVTDETPVARHAPSIAKHPVSRLIPLLKEEVPAPWTLMMPVVSMAPSVPVALPTPSPPVRYTAPCTEVVVAGVAVPTPSREFKVSNTRTVLEAALRIRKAWELLTEVWRVRRVEVL